MKFIVSREEFEAAFESLGNLVSVDKPLARDALAESLVVVRFMSFASIFSRAFFEGISAFSMGGGDNTFSLLVVDPDPAYYFREFGRYNAITFDKDDGPEDYLAVLNEGPPHGSSADSIMDSSNKLYLFSNNKKWLLIGDRDTNLTYCCFADSDTVAKFEKSYTGEFFPSTSSAEEFVSDLTGRTLSLSSFNP